MTRSVAARSRGRFAGLPKARPVPADEKADQRASADVTEPTEPTDATDPIEHAEATEPIERKLPLDPIERALPLDPIERNE